MKIPDYYWAIADYKNNSLRESIINRNPRIIIYIPIWCDERTGSAYTQNKKKRIHRPLLLLVHVTVFRFPLLTGLWLA